LQETSDADRSMHNPEFNHLYIIKKVWKIWALFDIAVVIKSGVLACFKNISRLPKMHAKALTCFNFFNFRPVSIKFPIHIKNVILTNRMVFVFRIATFLAGKWRHKFGGKKLTAIVIVNFMHLFGRRHWESHKTELRF
jgi:hypothetical protein